MKLLVSRLRALDRNSRRTLGMVLLVPGVLVTAVGIGYAAHPPFAAFVQEFLLTVFGLVATPIIFEITSVFVGMTLVLFFGWLRLVVFSTEWVEEMPEEAQPAMGEAEEAQVALAMAEGYLELGQVDDAHEAMLRVPRREWDTAPCQAVRLGVAVAQKRWGEARVLAAELEREDGEGAYSEAIARYEVARAAALVEDGSGTPGSRGAEAKQLLDRARERCPGAFPDV